MRFQLSCILGVFLTASNMVMADSNLLGQTGTSFRVALRAASTGYYVCANPTQPLCADREAANVWETFDLTPLGDGWYSLKAHSNGKFVRFENNLVIADRNEVGETEKIKVHVLSEADKIICLATKSRRLVCCDPRHANFLADRQAVGPWECFSLSFRTEYEPLKQLPEGLQRKWVVANGDWHKLEWAVGVPGTAFDAYFIGPKGAQVRAQYFITPNDAPKTLDGTTVTHVAVRGIYGEVAVKVPAATYVYYTATAGRIQTAIPFSPIELPLLAIPVDIFN